MIDKRDTYVYGDAEDRAIERYIERGRKEFMEDWREYLSDDMTRDEFNYYLSTQLYNLQGGDII